MKRCGIIILFLFLTVLTSAQVKNGAAGDSTNLSLSATVTTSFVSSWESLAAVKDGFEPAGSGDHSRGAYGNWNGEANFNKYNWVQCLSGKMSPGVYFAVFRAREGRSVHKIIVN